MENEAITENEELERQRVLRDTLRKEALIKKNQDPENDLSDDDVEKETSALNNMTLLDVAGDLLGWVPFLGGIVRAVIGVAVIIQSSKLNIRVRVKAWVINGLIAFVEVVLSLFGLNFLPLQTIGAIIIRVIANNAKQEKKQSE